MDPIPKLYVLSLVSICNQYFFHAEQQQKVMAADSRTGMPGCESPQSQVQWEK